MRRAYTGYAVNIYEGAGGSHEVRVLSGYLGDGCGSTDLWSYSRSTVYYDNVKNHADDYRGTHDRAAIITGIGRGIGNVAAHELLHQFSHDNWHDTNDQSSYDFWSCDRDEEFYGGDLHWTPRALGIIGGYLPHAN